MRSPLYNMIPDYQENQKFFCPCLTRDFAVADVRLRSGQPFHLTCWVACISVRLICRVPLQRSLVSGRIRNHNTEVLLQVERGD